MSINVRNYFLKMFINLEFSDVKNDHIICFHSINTSGVWSYNSC